MGFLVRLKHNQAMQGLRDRPNVPMRKTKWTLNAFVQHYFPLPWSCSTHTNEWQATSVTRNAPNSLAAGISLPSPHPATSLPGALRKKRRKVGIYEHVRGKQVSGVLFLWHFVIIIIISVVFGGQSTVVSPQMCLVKMSQMHERIHLLLLCCRKLKLLLK